MIINELIFYLKKHKIMILLLYFQVTLFLVLIGTFIACMDQLNYENKNLQDIYEGKSIYHLIDGYYESKDYQEFTSQPDFLNILKNFYNGLNSSDDFQFLAMFNHQILMKDERIPYEMIEGYEKGREKREKSINGEIYTYVKSFQMNEQALHFFDLNVSEGEIWSSDNFLDSQNIMPVLLGNSYKKTYNIGDEFSINFYQKPITIKITGFLEENSKIYYNGNTEFYLDRYIVLPYIDYGNPTSIIDEQFQKISYFAMINGYIINDSNTVLGQKMMQRIEAIAQKANFEKYSFINLNPNFKQYRGLMTVMQENEKLVQSVFVFSFFINIVILNLILVLQQKRRLSFLAIHYINGATKLRLIINQWIEVSVILFLSFLTNYIVLNRILWIGNYKTQLFLFIITFVMSIISCLLPAYKVIYNPIINSLQSEEERRN